MRSSEFRWSFFIRSIAYIAVASRGKVLGEGHICAPHLLVLEFELASLPHTGNTPISRASRLPGPSMFSSRLRQIPCRYTGCHATNHKLCKEIQGSISYIHRNKIEHRYIYICICMDKVASFFVIYRQTGFFFTKWPHFAEATFP